MPGGHEADDFRITTSELELTPHFDHHQVGIANQNAIGFRHPFILKPDLAVRDLSQIRDVIGMMKLLQVRPGVLPNPNGMKLGGQKCRQVGFSGTFRPNHGYYFGPVGTIR